MSSFHCGVGITLDSQFGDAVTGRRPGETTGDADRDESAADPRLRGACVERVRRARGGVVLVGVLHDHPASTYRVRAVVDAVDPAVLALELPPLAVPLTVHHAADERTPPTFGGEMSAAVQAADTDRVVGIDGPSVGFARSLAAELRAARASPATVRTALRSLRSVTARAITRRAVAAVATRTSLSLAVSVPTVYDTGHGDEPRRQAAEERRRMDTARAMLRSFTPPPAADITRTARERYMAARLAALCRADDVVAVVGMAHLDAVAGHLRDAT